MNIHVENAGGKCTLRPEGELTVYRAAQIREELLAALGSAQSLQVDLSQVTEMDSAGLQLLLLVSREAVRLGMSLDWVSHSQPVREVIGLCRLEPVLGHREALAA